MSDFKFGFDETPPSGIYRSGFEGTLTFTVAGTEPLLRIGKDGFWVRGVAVEQGPGEAEAVYAAMLDLLGMNLFPRPPLSTGPV